MTFSFRDRYRLLWRALCVAFNPRAREPTFIWRINNSPEIKPHCFYAEDTRSVDLILDAFSEVISRGDSIEDANKRATGFLLGAAARYCDKNKLPRDTVVVHSKVLLRKTQLERVEAEPTFTASHLNNV